MDTGAWVFLIGAIVFGGSLLFALVIAPLVGSNRRVLGNDNEEPAPSDDQ